MHDFRDSKTMAKALRELLAEKDVSITHSESLEFVARLFGLANWNVLAAKISNASREHLLTAGPKPVTSNQPRTPAISPFFIVEDVSRAIDFYTTRMDFSVGFKEPEDDPFFAVIYRDGSQIFLKSEQGIAPVPNHVRHPHLRWDAYVYSPDPDALFADFMRRGVPFSESLRDTNDGLRGFEVTDPDGFVLFFGRPR